jgi:hypothetical protein
MLRVQIVRDEVFSFKNKRCSRVTLHVNSK